MFPRSALLSAGNKIEQATRSSKGKRTKAWSIKQSTQEFETWEGENIVDHVRKVWQTFLTRAPWVTYTSHQEAFANTFDLKSCGTSLCNLTEGPRTMRLVLNCKRARGSIPHAVIGDGSWIIDVLE